MAETPDTPVLTAFPTTDAAPVHLRRSPLAHLAEALAAGSRSGTAADPGLTLREVPFLTMVGLRATPDGEAAAAFSSVLGVELPAGVGRVTGAAHVTDRGPAPGVEDSTAAAAGTAAGSDPGHGTAVLWLGPDEHLVVAAPDLPLAGRLQEALGAAPGAAVDLSANRTTLELTGARARDVLDTGCRIDLHPREFPPGTAVATLFAEIPVIVWRCGEESYRIMPRASFADHVARRLLDGMREFTGREA